MAQFQPEKLRLKGKIGHFLILLLIIHFAYPYSEGGRWASAIWITFYSLSVGYGAYLTSQSALQVRMTGALTLLTILTGIVWAFNSNDGLVNSALYVFYVVIIANLAFIIQNFFRFVFLAKMVTRDVLFGGVSIYMLIGNIFTPIYLLLNAIYFDLKEQNAFGVHTYEVEIITWQRMYYLSFTVLTTLGFGDITPVIPYAEPFVLAEAGIGVLYVAILMARLVSLYETHQSSMAN